MTIYSIVWFCLILNFKKQHPTAVILSHSSFWYSPTFMHVAIIYSLHHIIGSYKYTTFIAKQIVKCLLCTGIVQGTGDAAVRRTDTTSLLTVRIFQWEEFTARLTYPIFYEGTFVVFYFVSELLLLSTWAWGLLRCWGFSMAVDFYFLCWIYWGDIG